MNPDFWELERTPGFFADRNDGARWLQEHLEDPYWMAHQLAEIDRDYSNFKEYWEMAREIHGYCPILD